MGHIHRDSEYDFTASALIVHNERVLLLFHTKLQLWLPPAGHIELTETPVEALHREVEEETGIAKKHLTFVMPFADNFHFQRDPENKTEPLPFDIETHTVNSGGHRHIDLRYILISDTNAITREEDKAEHLAWFTLEEMKELSPLPKSIYSCAHYALEKAKELQK